MKKLAWITVSLALLAGGFAAGKLSSRGGGAAGRQVLYYVDPMHPAYRSDKPGIAPDCGMQLEPVYADGGAADGVAAKPAGTLEITAEKQQLIGVRLGEVESGPATHALRLFGRVEPDEARVYTVNSAVHGYVQQVSGVTTGTRVRKGQWLATIFSIDLRAPAQAYLSAIEVLEAASERDALAAEVRNAEIGPALAVERLKNIGMSGGQIEEIRRTREVPLTIRITSPANGFVLARNASPGQKFDKGTEWYRIADLDRVWIVADVFEADARFVRPGMEARLSVAGGPNLTATVADVLPQFDPATRSMKVRLEADNPGYALRPGMFVDVELPIELPPTLAVPVDAVIDSGLRKTVFVDRGNGFFEPRSVDTGWRLGDRVEIVSGLRPGERIVVSGTFLVDSEARLKAASAGIHGAPARDPVCGMDVDEAKARAAGKTVEAGGKTFFFCSLGCKHAFEASPDRFTQSSFAEHRESGGEQSGTH